MAGSKKGMLSDVFDGTFRMLSRTWLTTLVCGGVLFIPAALLYGWSFGRFFDAIAAMAEAEESDSILLSMGLGYLWIMVAALLLGFAMLFVRACVTEHTARLARGESPDLPGIVWHVFSRRYGRLIGQRALQYTILVAIMIGATLIGGISFGISLAVELPLVGTLGITLGVLAGAVIVTWLSIRWSLTLETVVIEDAKISSSLGRSEDLVRGAWWRVLGYTLLLSLMMGFAVSLIATPIVFFASIREYVRFLGGLLKGGEGEGDAISLMRSLFGGMGLRFAILMYIQSLFAMLVTPVFMTLLFLELRKRTDAAAPADAPPASELPAAELPAAELPASGPAGTQASP